MANGFNFGGDIGGNLSSLLGQAGQTIAGGASPVLQAARSAIQTSGERARRRLRSSAADRGLTGSGIAASAEAELSAREGGELAGAEASAISQAVNQALKILGMQTQREQFEAQQPGFGDILGTIGGTLLGPLGKKAGKAIANIF